jgi:hypothetical protein
MQQHLVLWGDIATDRKALLAIYLEEISAKVHVYAFPKEIATKELQEQLFLWKNGGEYAFPEDAIHWIQDANSDHILPENVRVDKPEFITKAQEHWSKKLLSTRFYQVFVEELNLLQQKADIATHYEQSLWDKTRNTWDKIAEHKKNNELNWEQIDVLKNKIDHIFEALKAIKRLDTEHRSEETHKVFKIIKNQIEEQQSRLIYNEEWGNIFDTLKNIQNELKNANLRWEEKRKLFDSINEVFDNLRKYRKTEFLNRTKERISQLTKTVEGLQQSIERDKENQNLQIEKLSMYTRGKLSVEEMKQRFNIITDRVSEKEKKIKNILQTIKQLEKEIEKENNKQENTTTKQNTPVKESIPKNTSAKNKTIPPIENKIEENTNEPILDSEEKTDLLINEENQEKIDIVSTNEDKEAENN